MKKLIFSVFIFLLFLVLALSINMRNPGSITLNYYFGWQVQVDLFVVIFVPFLLGLVFGALLMSVSVFRNKMAAGRSKRQLAKVEKEVENLRAMPASSGPALPGSDNS
jgi:uncharacterized membrane protein YciS (DUF1049 family)